MPRQIKTKTEHKAALRRIDRLMNAERSDDIAELSILATLVEKYEREAFPIEPPSALDAIR